MGKRLIITESDVEHISKLYNLNETYHVSSEKEREIIIFLHQIIINWDNYSSPSQSPMDKAMGNFIDHMNSYYPI